MANQTGYIYILTNESFHKDNWIKIGYAENVEKRVKELSNTSVPLPYEVYCTYEIPRIHGTKDPDKLLHALITKLNPSLRISPNREFFEMLPWDAYDMLSAIAQMHGRMDKLKRNGDNQTVKNVQNDAEYTVDLLFPQNALTYPLYVRLKKLILAEETSLQEVPTKLYVAYKYGNKNTISLWPKSNCIEATLNAKLGTISDDNDLIYDISNRQWTSEQYAFKYYENSDDEKVKNIIKQTIQLKRK